MIPGTPMPQPGIYLGVPDSEYYAVAAISKSRIDMLRRSPAHLWASFTAPREETDAMRAGKLLHCLVLEPDLYERRYIVVDANRSTKAGKAAVAEAGASGLIPLKPSEYDEARAMTDAIRKHPVASALLSAPGESELTAYWEEEIDGLCIPCKMRLDRLVHDLPGFGPVLLDVKTARDASPRAMAKHIAEYGYHRQAPWYRRGLRMAGGLDSRQFTLVCVESSPPYLVGVYNISEAAQGQGLRELTEALHLLAACIQSGEWPGYPVEVVELDLPVWAYR
ncbi:MAG TPA: PD-(D/E)XK nuclease-like domain-containing protein [Nitratidesulfovibrio sp.]|nr:PD-(D/E)XK nuclease-like domain-containing protein [Nitratidesulfovibrio sp.]